MKKNWEIELNTAITSAKTLDELNEVFGPMRGLFEVMGQRRKALAVDVINQEGLGAFLARYGQGAPGTVMTPPVKVQTTKPKVQSEARKGNFTKASGEASSKDLMKVLNVEGKTIAAIRKELGGVKVAPVLQKLISEKKAQYTGGHGGGRIVALAS